jgi:hypothetical protein
MLSWCLISWRIQATIAVLQDHVLPFTQGGIPQVAVPIVGREMLYFSSLALAGSVYYLDVPQSEIFSLDTRDIVSTPIASAGMQTAASGMALDPLAGELWLYTPYPVLGANQLRRIDIQTGRSYYIGMPNQVSTGLAFDPVNQRLIAVDANGTYSFSIATGQSTLLAPGLETVGLDWFDDGAFIMAIESTTGDFYEISPPAAPIRRWSSPSPHRVNAGGLVYDSDTRTFWFLSNGSASVYDPETFSLIGAFYIDHQMDGGAGSIDDVANQTPELLVSGSCPGTMYATVVDATPGGHVQFGSSTRTGAKVISGGACAGTRLGLRSPTPRYDLVANSYGIASTTFQATPAMCGAQLLQAVDMDTCLATSVRTVEMVLYP